MMHPRRTLIATLGTVLTAIVLLLVCSFSFATELAQGEIRKVDKAAAKITIKHGDIPSIAMPPMTMVFGVRDAAWLENAKAGDKIRFDAVLEGGKYIVTRLEVDR